MISFENKIKRKIFIASVFALAFVSGVGAASAACTQGECKPNCLDSEKPSGETCLFSVGDYNQPGVCCVKKSGAGLTSGKVCAEENGKTVGTCHVGASCYGVGPGLALAPQGELGCPSDQICCKTQQYHDETQGKPELGSQAPTGQGTSSSSSTSRDPGGLVPCDTQCTLCHIIVGFKRIFDFFIGLLFVATMLAITVAGVFYMISSGSKALTETAKKSLTYALTAFVIGMGSWIIVNTVMVGLGFKHPYGGNWWEFTCDTSKSSGPTGTPDAPGWSGERPNAAAGDGTCGGTKDYVEDKANCAKTSKQLDDVLSCIKGKVAFNHEKKNKNLFFDTAFAAGRLSIGLGVDNPGHVTNSCHYGGRYCRGQGNAADLTGDLPALKDAAIACGADSVIHNGMAYYGGTSKPYTGANPHSTHVHISVNNYHCGCDYLQ